MAINLNTLQTSIVSCPTYTNIPFVQIHTTDVQPQKINFGNVFRRSNINNTINKQEIKSEPIKSESADITIKERLNGTPTPPSRVQQVINQNQNVVALPECDVQQQEEKEIKNQSNQLNNNISIDSGTHLENYIDIFKCSQCPYICLNNSDLNEHMKKVHINIVTSKINVEQRMKLKCLGCLNVFYALQSLELHYKLDHLMSAENIQKLMGNVVTTVLTTDDNTQTSSRIFLKNVKHLCEPTTIITTTSSNQNYNTNGSQNDPNFSDFIKTVSINHDKQTDTTISATPKQKISIKSVDVLREPTLLQYDDFNSQYNANIKHNASHHTLNNNININTNTNSSSTTNSNSYNSSKHFLNDFLLPIATTTTTINDISNYQLPFDDNHSEELYHYSMNSLITTSPIITTTTTTTTAITSGTVAPATQIRTPTTIAGSVLASTSKTIEYIDNNYIINDETILPLAVEMEVNRVTPPLKQPKIYVKNVKSFNLANTSDIDNNYYAINENLLNMNNELYEDNNDDGNCNGSGNNLLPLPFPYDPDGTSVGISHDNNFINIENTLNTFSFLNSFNNNDCIVSNNSNNNSNSDHDNNADNTTINFNNNNNNNSSNNYILESSLLNNTSFDCNVINAISTQSQDINLPVMHQSSLSEYENTKTDLNVKKLPSQFSFCHETRGTLHLRTVDELNLLNENEVQNLIAPNLENNNSNYNSSKSSSNHHHERNDYLINANNSGKTVATSIVPLVNTATPTPIISSSTTIASSSSSSIAAATTTTTMISTLSNTNATNQLTNSLDAIHILQDTFYPDDSFKFHDLDTQMVNNWSDNYEELAQDINYIIDHNTTAVTTTSMATASTIATKLVISPIENNTICRLSDKRDQSSDDNNIDAPLNTLICIRDIDQLTDVAANDDSIPVITSTSASTVMTKTTAAIQNENLKDYKHCQHHHQQQQQQQQKQQQQNSLQQSALIPLNDCNTQIELNLLNNNNNNNTNGEYLNTRLYKESNVSLPDALISENKVDSHHSSTSSLLRISKDNNNSADVPPLVPVSKTAFHGNNIEKTLQNDYNHNVIESIRHLPVPPLIKFTNNNNNNKNLNDQKMKSPALLSLSKPLALPSNGPIEKGRIYVANNLMQQPKQTQTVILKTKTTTDTIVETNVNCINSSSKISNTSIRGRPYGFNHSYDKKNIQNANVKKVHIKNSLKCPVKSCTFRFKKLETLEYHKNCHYHNNNNNNDDDKHQHDSDKMRKNFQMINQKHKIICPECKTLKFNNWNTLHTHLWRQHQIDMELYKCELCNFRTPIYSRLINTHTKIHLDERNFKCEKCGKAFKNAKQLKNHRRWHRLQLKMHNNNYNDNCNDKCDNNENERIKNKKSMIHACPKCGVAYSHLKSLREHFCKTSVTDGGMQLKCNLCQKLMSTKASLKLHCLTQHNVDCNSHEQRYKCQLCVYTTNDHNAIRRHKMCHEKKTKYQCQYCDYKAVQSAAYQKHIRHKHPDKANIVLHKCLKCNFCTVSRSLLITHESKHSASISIPAHSDNRSCTSELRNDRNTKHDNKQMYCNNINKHNTNTEQPDENNVNTIPNVELFKTKIKVKSNLFNVQQDEDASLQSLHSIT